MLAKRWVVALPPQWKNSQAAKNRQKTAHPVSTMKKRRLLAILVSMRELPHLQA
jgi:hypothetical protein